MFKWNLELHTWMLCDSAFLYLQYNRHISVMMQKLCI